VRRWLAALLVTGAAVGVAVAAAHEPEDAPTPLAAPTPTPVPDPLPAPGAALPRDPEGLAAALARTTRRLHDAVEQWDPAQAVPRDVTYLALHHQRMIRLMTDRRRLGDATLERLPADVRDEARDTVLARRDLAAIPRAPGELPRVRIAGAAPAAELRRHYATAQRRFHVHWSVLAAINFVESAFGRVRSASEAGARGPMQFLPATWRAYGMGGDIDKPRDAILAAANYLRRSGAREDLDRALYSYNHSTSYVRAIRRFAKRMRTDERAMLVYYSWQVYIRTPQGTRRVTGPGRD
jgi:membrane-bound lytic murein transglycosylase B